MSDRLQVLMSAVGSAGDVHPFLCIGRALARRGHDVELLASPHFRQRIEDAGIGFGALGTEADYDRIVRDAGLWDPKYGFESIWREMQPQLLDAHAAVLARIRPGPTVLVGSTLAWHMRLAQETQRLPAATVHLSPLCIFSAQAPARIPGLQDLGRWPAWAVRVLHALFERVYLDRLLAPGLDATRRRLGLAPVRHVMSRWIHAPQRVVCAWPEWYAPVRSDWPAQAVTTGFPRWDAAPGASLPPALDAFLAAGPPPLGFTPGSAMAHGRRFFEQALAACDALGARALLISPYADQLPSPLPAFAHAVPYAPFDLLLPRLRLLVHHGGIGTAAQALAAGLPQGLVPFAHDQFDNAQRLVRRGVGLELRLDDARDAWVAALQRLQHDPQIAASCRRDARLVADAGDPAERIADLIEALDDRPHAAATR
jgi:rhamnosyltransferase subunit B